MKFRKLRADEIDVRVGGVAQDARGAWLLLYKDARCDMNILDETVGVYGWQRHHEVIGGNLYCTISLWDEEKKMWIEKQDVGTESNQDKEKGQASDAFKRACFNLGIGRELYTAPFTWVSDNSISDKKDWNKKKFKVSHISYDEFGKINELEIKEKLKGGKEKTVFQFKGRQANVRSEVKNQPELFEKENPLTADEWENIKRHAINNNFGDIIGAINMKYMLASPRDWTQFHKDRYFEEVEKAQNK